MCSSKRFSFFGAQFHTKIICRWSGVGPVVDKYVNLSYNDESPDEYVLVITDEKDKNHLIFVEPDVWRMTSIGDSALKEPL